MKKTIFIIACFLTFTGYAQSNEPTTYKKRVLETPEVSILTSYYSQDGDNAAVTGGIGTEELKDVAGNIVISIPLNANDVFTIDGTVSAYSSASSSNLNPFDSGASKGGDDDDDDDEYERKNKIAGTNSTTGSPWVESSGASRSDVWASGTIAYNHSSDSRNTIVGGNISFANEYDYSSFGVGANFAQLFNAKNTEVGISVNAYFDKWRPAYPTELISYEEENGNLNAGFFEGIDILDQNGTVINKNGAVVWNPTNYSLITNTSRNTYAASISFSQIISKKAQFSVFLDLVQQSGWLSNPMQRVYFGDKENYYIGNGASIPFYTSKQNTDVFRLADDIERLPDTRFKTPIGARFNYYLNEIIVIRTYYRYYADDWGISSNTAIVELPIKISDKFTLYPSYRYYTQTAADYFAPFEAHNSTEEFYTSDYDLSEFNANQYGLGVTYTDIFTKAHIWHFGIKSIDLKYDYYQRNTGLTAGIVTAGIKFAMK
ncbi:DUF3570 domain-containing protein [Lutibacter sp. HS1-25]|uniref:DUF3570 domain-containing protein n=1 Tax=Lutibacter sp. HS1-25 TaxID=2485000 RepID=UPI001011E034|nr:DUF3570 domain-containing protein [Lutibacter sp. HS1-25]RXP60316.1 DUF3570 domain-containing protein [Lutibacter sp. HS1-25]